MLADRETGRRLVATHFICSLASQDDIRSSFIDADMIGLLLERLHNDNFRVQISSLDALAQLVIHASAERRASALPQIITCLNTLNHGIDKEEHDTQWHGGDSDDNTGYNNSDSDSRKYREIDTNVTTIPKNKLEKIRAACLRCLSHAFRNEACRTFLLESGLVYILVEMLRDGYCDTRAMAIQHIGDLVQYDDFRHLLMEHTFTTPMAGILRQSIRTEQCYLFVATVMMIRHDDIRGKLLKSGFVPCLLVTLKFVTSAFSDEKLPEKFPKLLRSCLDALWSYADSQALLAHFGYSPAVLANFGQ